MPRGEHTKQYIAFYTCFFGKYNNKANVIPMAPSDYYDCYFFSNNIETLKHVKSPWKPIFVDIPIKASHKENAMDSKELKACPHRYRILNGYDYTCYFDSKLRVKDYEVLDIIRSTFKNKKQKLILNKHAFLEPNVWLEFKQAMLQPRYAVDKQHYKKYIEKQLARGYDEEVETHYQTGFIIRKGDCRDINETWFEEIQEAGIECQISFFFVQQMFPGAIVPLEGNYGSRKSLP